MQVLNVLTCILHLCYARALQQEEDGLPSQIEQQLL
jgi:hypothetical protein